MMLITKTVSCKVMGQMKIEILEVVNAETNKPATINEAWDCLDKDLRSQFYNNASEATFGIDDEGDLVLMGWNGNFIYAPDQFVVSKVQFSFEDGPIMIMKDEMLIWRKKDV